MQTTIPKKCSKITSTPYPMNNEVKKSKRKGPRSYRTESVSSRRRKGRFQQSLNII